MQKVCKKFNNQKSKISIKKNPRTRIFLKNGLIIQKSQKITFFQKSYFFFQQKNKLIKSSLFFNIRTTGFDQNSLDWTFWTLSRLLSLVQPNPEKKNLKKSGKIQKIFFFFKNRKILKRKKNSEKRRRKKCYHLIFPI